MEGNFSTQFLISTLTGIGLGVLIYYLLVIPRSRRKTAAILRERMDEFVAISSHYLLTPIAIIQTAVTSLQDRDEVMTTDQRQHMYEAIFRGQQRLWVLAEQFRIVGEVDNGGLKLNLGVSNVFDVVSDAFEVVYPFAKEKKLEISLKDEGVAEAKFDVKLIKHAVIAILDNSIKFSNEGGKIQVSVKMNSGLFTVVVEDQGVGMDNEVVSHLTERFYRGNKLYKFDYEGVGLGLHVAQAIMLEHQGSLVFESRKDQGTRVTMEFAGY